MHQTIWVNPLLSRRPDKGDPTLVILVKEVLVLVADIIVEEGQPAGAALWRRPRLEQEGAAADAVHQQRLRQPQRLHTQRPLRHQAIQD